MTTWTPIPNASEPFNTQEVTNGNFASPSGWFITLNGTSLDPLPGFGWAYGTNQVIHTANVTLRSLVQNIGVTPFTEYRVTFDVVVNQGILSVILGNSSEGIVGTFTTTQSADVVVTTGANSNPDLDSLLRFQPSTGAGGFDGTITNINVYTRTNIWVSIPISTSPTWNNITNPSNSSVTTGYAYGLLMAITRPATIPGDSWSRVSPNTAAWTKLNDNSTSWTNVPNAV